MAKDEAPQSKLQTKCEFFAEGPQLRLKAQNSATSKRFRLDRQVF